MNSFDDNTKESKPDKEIIRKRWYPDFSDIESFSVILEFLHMDVSVLNEDTSIIFIKIVGNTEWISRSFEILTNIPSLYDLKNNPEKYDIIVLNDYLKKSDIDSKGLIFIVATDRIHQFYNFLKDNSPYYITSEILSRILNIPDMDPDDDRCRYVDLIHEIRIKTPKKYFFKYNLNVDNIDDIIYKNSQMGKIIPDSEKVVILTQEGMYYIADRKLFSSMTPVLDNAGISVVSVI